MAIIYDPSKIISKMAPKSKIKKMLSKEMKVKKAALSFVDDSEVVSKKQVTTVANKVVKSYKKRIKAGELTAEEAMKDPALLINRIQNEVLLQVQEHIKETYRGEKYRWLPSDAEEPDPEHQLNYWKVFTVGEGEMPQDRYGCRCGMEILTEDTKLEL